MRQTWQPLEQVWQEQGPMGRKRLAKAANCSPRLAQEFIKWKQGKREAATDQRTPRPHPQTSPPLPPDPSETRIIVENRILRKQVEDQRSHIEKLSLASELLTGIASAQLSPPEWTIKTSGKTSRAIATAMLADCHLDEVVNPAEVGYVNAYNREIARLRLREFFSNTVKLGRDFFAGSKIEGLVLAMAGDIVSGAIHEELMQTNAAAILDTCLYWSAEIAAGMEQLLTFYPHVFAPCVVGNHGRLSRKPRHKGRVRDNFDYLIYALLARHFKDSDKVTFLIPDTADCHFQVYNVRYCLTHGDQFRGGTGIAGALSPLLLGDARKRKRSVAVNNSYDYMLGGHWHQSIDTCGIVMANSMKGMDEYAMNNNFPFSEPSQPFWLTDSEKGRTLRAPIHVRSREENWRQEVEAQPEWLR